MLCRGDSSGPGSPRLTARRGPGGLAPDMTEQNPPEELVELAPRPPSLSSPLPASATLPDRGLVTMIWALGVAASFMLAMAFGALWYATRADLGATRVNVAQL